MKGELAITITSPSGEKWALVPFPRDSDVFGAWLEEIEVPKIPVFFMIIAIITTTRAPHVGVSVSLMSTDGWTVTVTGIRKKIK